MWVFGVALQVRIFLHQICPPKCFCIPRMGVFKMRSAKTCRVLAWRSKRACLCTKSARKTVFGSLVQGCLRCAIPEKCGFLAWRTKRAYLYTTSARQSAGKSVFGCLVWGCLKYAISDSPILGIQNHFCWQIWCRSMRAWGATPNTHIFWYRALQTPLS